MKTALTYGIGIAVAGALLTLVTYFLGYHNELEKMMSGTAQILGMLNWVILIVGITQAVRARRDTSDDGSMSYGQGVGTGALTGLFAGLFTGVFTSLYATAINPAFIETLRDQQRAVMAERGNSPAQIDQAAAVMEKFTSPAVITVAAVLFSIFFGLLVALVAAAFLKRAAPAPTFEPPPLRS